MRYLVLLLVAWAQAMEPKAPHHVFDVPVPDNMQLPPEMAAKKGRLVCSSCHGIDIKQSDQVDKHQPDFLIGGPYARLENFCFRCHEDQGYQRWNIHHQLDERGQIRKKNCLYCHLKVLDRQQPDQDQALRLPPSKLCLGCHLKTPHLNALSHQKKPEEPMRKRMQKNGLPLDEQGQVSCISCHDPHQDGVLQSGKAVAERSVHQGPLYLPSRWQPVFAEDKAERLQAIGMDLQYQRLAAEVLMRLPAKDGQLCLACHQFED